MKRRFMRWFRRVILRSAYPDSSRAVLESRLRHSANYILELRHDLRLACLHGLWREHHPLSAKNVTHSRFAPVFDISPAPTKALSDGMPHPLNTDAPNIDCASQIQQLEELQRTLGAAIADMKSGAIYFPAKEWALKPGEIAIGNYVISPLANRAAVCDTESNE